MSTRGGAPPATFREALLAGLAPDGGLYLPARIEPLPAPALDALRGASLVDTGVAVAHHLLRGEVPRAILARIVGEALDFPIPLVPVGDSGARALELFHGPTLAFKDVGARVMARFMAHVVAPDEPPTVLVATSGDTGGAVAHAFAGIPGARVVVLFPEGQVSAVQEAQFTTLGEGVRALAVEGTFDECQALVKGAFADERLRRRARLTSANSINVGRLLPQIFYYAWASTAERSDRSGRSERSDRSRGSDRSDRCTFSVPSGNFGNLTAGVIAARLGFPVGRLIAATNVNDVVPQYLASGVYEPRASRPTIANAMDVGAPSNFERLRALYDGDVRRMREDLSGVAFDDRQIVAAIADVHARYGCVLDPHSAIAWLGLGGSPGVFLATAHPAKFRESVEPAIGRPIGLPDALAAAMRRPRRVTRLAPRHEDLARIIAGELSA